MILAVIARALGPRPTGRGLVAAELVRAVRRGLPAVEIHLFAGAAPDWPDIVWHPAGGPGLLSDLWRMSTGIARDLRRLRPDALWCATHLLPGGLDPNLPTVVTLLDVVWRDHPETMTWRNRATAQWGEKGLTRADRILCISEFTRARLMHHWPALGERARIIKIAPTSSLLEDRPCGPPPDRPLIVNVDTVEPRKNLGVLLAAMKPLPLANLIQCGARGWDGGELVSAADRLSNVTMMGYKDESVIHCLYRQATAAVFPSIYEGFHLPPLEAMALGCPVIASDIPVHREVLGDAAVYVSPSDVPGLTAAIRRLIESPGERARLAAAGRAQAARYSWDDAARGLLAVIEEAIDERRARRTSDRS